MATNLPSCFSFFRTTPEVSSKLYFVEICQVPEKLWLLITKELIFDFQILDLKDHISTSLSQYITILSFPGALLFAALLKMLYSTSDVSSYSFGLTFLQ